MKKIILTLCLIQKPNYVLLGLKKRGFGANRWNGFGGKVEVGETLEQAAIREVWEECRLKLNKVTEFAMLEFEFQDSQEILEVHIFHGGDFSGEPQETEEMKPQWFAKDQIPFDQMWPDDRLWFPLFLANKKFSGKIILADINTIISHNIKES